MSPIASSRDHLVTYQLTIKPLFDKLSQKEKLYAHHLSQAAWHGSRIILRQTSPEGPGIFDFILELHKACEGHWNQFTENFGVSVEELDAFLDFAGMFMSKLNNFCGEGDRKIVPQVSASCMRKLASISPTATSALERVINPMLSATPTALGLSGSGYYIGNADITIKEIASIARVMEKHAIEPENTRLRKEVCEGNVVYNILQACAQKNVALRDHLKGTAIPIETLSGFDDEQLSDQIINLERGDHSEEMSKICEHLIKAVRFSANETQARYIMEYIDSFTTGSLEAYRRSMKHWVTDPDPTVESIFGFIEPYRDPYGARCEWRAVIGIDDPYETAKLKALVASSTKFIRTLPWAVPNDNDGKGPFEKANFQAPHFSIVHALTFVCSNVWEASNVPNYDDIREVNGFKNIVYANRMSANADPNRSFHWVHPSEAKVFKRLNHIIRFIVTSIHELLGHGTGKLLAESSPGIFNFDTEYPPINTLTGKSIKSWYGAGQTWTSVFGKLAGTVEECRATLISYYLGENKELLALYGYDEGSHVTADELIYYIYLHIGVEGLRALQAFNVEEQMWGGAHANANYAIFKYLMLNANALLSVDCDDSPGALYVRVDRSKIHSHGKSSISHMLHHIHIWRCTADITSCKAFYETLSAVDGEFEIWRKIVAAKPDPPWKFVQANTLLMDDGNVMLKVYEESNEGIIQSFADRCI